MDESKKNRQEDFRRKLRPQGDGTMMDKAKELTNKKNRNTKGNTFCSVLSSPDDALLDIASKLHVHLGDDEEQRMASIGLIKTLESARYSIFCESIKNAKKTDKEGKENDPIPLDLNSLNDLLSDEDQDLGEMDGCDEVHLSFVSPTRKQKKSKPPDLTSVKPRVKVRRRKKK